MELDPEEIRMNKRRQVTPVYWATCRCYVWPLVPGYVVRRCGYCGSHPDRAVKAPSTGAAMPLVRYIEEEA